MGEVCFRVSLIGVTLNKKGHFYGAIAFAPLPCNLMGQVSIEYGAIAALSCVISSSLPDQLEFGRIPHRTITHTLSIWLLLSYFGYGLSFGEFALLIGEFAEYNGITGAALCGVGSGGVSHWLGDVFNKKPVPIFTPLDGMALRLFHSGEHQTLTCFFIAVISLSALASLR